MDALLVGVVVRILRDLDGDEAPGVVLPAGVGTLLVDLLGRFRALYLSKAFDGSSVTLDFSIMNLIIEELVAHMFCDVGLLFGFAKGNPCLVLTDFSLLNSGGQL